MRSEGRWARWLMAAWLVGCAAAPGEVGEDELEGPALEEGQEKIFSTNGLLRINGLLRFNGADAVNGLRAINGLRLYNGLRMVNGLEVVTGLGTVSGAVSVNGRSVDCDGTKRPGHRCTGEPDGLLSRTTGLMSSDEGISTATYMVRCALQPSQQLKILDYQGNLVTLQGSIGLAPEFEYGDCGQDCQEKVSACMMALVNGAGRHVEIELASPLPELGLGHSLPLQEGAFYGNIFGDEAEMYFCMGSDNKMPRMCNVYDSASLSACPFYVTGSCRGIFRTLGNGSHVGSDCTFTSDGVMTSCRGRAKPLYSRLVNRTFQTVYGDSKVYRNIITTFRTGEEAEWDQRRLDWARQCAMPTRPSSCTSTDPWVGWLDGYEWQGGGARKVVR